MGVIVSAAAFCAVALLVYVLRYSGRLRVAQTRLVGAAPADVAARVADLGRFCDWNPWLDGPAPPVHGAPFAAARCRCAWSRAGESVASIEQVESAPGRIEQRLRFREPFAWRGRATWSFEPHAAGTRVTWSLRGTVAFALRAFAPTVQGALALELRYGLDRLAARMEGEAAPGYAVEYAGVRDMPARRFAYRALSASIDAAGRAMDAAAAALEGVLAEAGVATGGERLAIYLHTDVRRRRTSGRAAVACAGALPDGIEAGELAAHRAFVTRLVGDPSVLELAWYLAVRRMRALGLEPDLARPPYERRRAGAPAAPAAVVELCIPLRAARLA
jgi:hypothetical protein